MSRTALGIPKMTRITISMNSQVEAKIMEIQQHLTKIDGKPQSISKVINTVLVAGIVGSSKLSVYEWTVIMSFIKGKRIDLEAATGEEYLSNILALSQ